MGEKPRRKGEGGKSYGITEGKAVFLTWEGRWRCNKAPAALRQVGASINWCPICYGQVKMAMRAAINQECLWLLLLCPSPCPFGEDSPKDALLWSGAGLARQTCSSIVADCGIVLRQARAPHSVTKPKKKR